MRTLLTDTQLGDEGTIALDVLLGQIVQQAAALTDHLVQAPAAVVVVGVYLQVLGELIDPLGEDGDLNLGGTGVGFVGAVGLDDGGLLIFPINSPQAAPGQVPPPSKPGKVRGICGPRTKLL